MVKPNQNIFTNYKEMYLINSYKNPIITGYTDGQIQFSFTTISLVSNLFKSTDFGANFSLTQPFASGYDFKNAQISSDGNKMYSCGSNYIISSIDMGLNWTTITATNITSIGVSSFDGQYISQTKTTAGVYVSNNYGVSFTNNLAVLAKMVQVSYTGQYQLAVLNAMPWVSSDYGVTWAQHGTSKNYQSCAMSLSGQYMVAVAYNSTLSYSNDYGITWSNKGTSQQLYTCAISNSGQHIVMGGNTFIRVSNDYGATWADKGVSTNTWFYSGISGSGQYMVMTNPTSMTMYVSSDYGATWSTRGASNVWKGCAINRQ